MLQNLVLLGDRKKKLALLLRERELHQAERDACFRAGCFLPFALAATLTIGLPSGVTFADDPPSDASAIYAKENLVAWCIVPFDAKQRGPEKRAAMLERLGIRKLAYDYRAQHIPMFDAEMQALKKHGIELTAWWFPRTLNDEARHILSVLKRHRVKTQLWVSGSGGG